MPSHRFCSATGEQKGITQTIYTDSEPPSRMPNSIMPSAKLRSANLPSRAKTYGDATSTFYIFFYCNHTFMYSHSPRKSFLPFRRLSEKAFMDFNQALYPTCSHNSFIQRLNTSGIKFKQAPPVYSFVYL